MGRLDKDSVFAAAPQQKKAAVAHGGDHRQGGAGQSLPVCRNRPRLEAETFSAPDHFHDADGSTGKLMLDLLWRNGDALTAQDEHERGQAGVG